MAPALHDSGSMHAEARAWLAEEAKAKEKSQKTLEALEPKPPSPPQLSEEEQFLQQVSAEEVTAAILATLDTAAVKFLGKRYELTESEAQRLHKVWLPVTKKYFPKDAAISVEALALGITAVVYLPKVLASNPVPETKQPEPAAPSPTPIQERAA